MQLSRLLRLFKLMHAADGAAVAQDVHARQVAVALVGQRLDAVALGGVAAFGVGGAPTQEIITK